MNIITENENIIGFADEIMESFAEELENFPALVAQLSELDHQLIILKYHSSDEYFIKKLIEA